MNFIKKIFGIVPDPDYKALLSQGAVIIDVRSPSEYGAGHIKGSTNIPLDKLKTHVTKLNKQKAIITCCASGMRSASAKNILLSSGFSEVYNGGGWFGLDRKLKSSHQL